MGWIGRRETGLTLPAQARGFVHQFFQVWVVGPRWMGDHLIEAVDGLGATASFEQTLALVRDSRFSALFAFCFSPRPGTAALRLLDEAVPEQVAGERLQRLLDCQNEVQAQLNAELVGREMDVLVTGFGKLPGRFTGRTSCHRIVHFGDPGNLGAGSPRPGRMTRVRIVRSQPHSLLATPAAG